jgi:hypothetical protein
MRILTFVMAAVLGLMLGSYAQVPGPEVIRGRSFALLDNEGHKRGEWLVDNTGRGVMRMFDRTGKVIWSSAGGVSLLGR